VMLVATPQFSKTMFLYFLLSSILPVIHNFSAILYIVPLLRTIGMGYFIQTVDNIFSVTHALQKYKWTFFVQQKHFSRAPTIALEGRQLYCMAILHSICHTHKTRKNSASFAWQKQACIFLHLGAHLMECFVVLVDGCQSFGGLCCFLLRGLSWWWKQNIPPKLRMVSHPRT
jgi:hypothetical protein